MAMTITTPHATGQIDSVSGITVNAKSATFASGDVGRIIYLTTGDGAGQYRRIVEYTDTQTVDVDYPWDVSAFQEESYANGDAITDVAPSENDYFTVSSNFGDLASIDGYSATWQNVDTTERRATLIEGETFSVGSGATDTTRVVFYEESYRFKWNSKNIYNYAPRTSGLGSAIVLGRLDPGYVVNHTIASGGTAISSVAANEVVHKSGSPGEIWKNVSGGSLSNQDYDDVGDGDNWSQITANGQSIATCFVELTDHDSGDSSTGLWYGNGQNANNGTSNSGLNNAYGHFHHNGTYWYINPLSNANIPDDANWTGPDADLYRVTSSHDPRLFWRIFGLENTDSNTRSFVRLYENIFEGPIGGRLRGEKSFVLNCQFIRGGNTAGPFNPTYNGDSYFGLWKGNTLHDKDTGAYIWFSRGSDVAIFGPEFTEVDSMAYIADGSVTNARLRFVDFDMDLLNTGIRPSTDDVTTGFVNVQDVSTSTRVRIENSIQVDIVSSDLTPNTEPSKLGWTDSQNLDNRAWDDTADGGTIPETSTGEFDSVRLLKWDSGQLADDTVLQIDASNSTDHGDYNFAIVSYGNENVYFNNDLRGVRELQYTVVADDTVTETYTATNSYTEIDTAQKWRNRGKALQYDDMHDLPNVQEEFIIFNSEGTGGRAQVNQGGSAYVADVVFATTGANVMSYDTTNDRYDIKIPATGFTDDIILDTGSDLTIPASVPIIGAVTCGTLNNSWTNDSTTSVINTDGAQNYTTQIDNSSGDVTIVIEDANIEDLTLTVASTSNDATVIIKGDVTGLGDCISNSSTHISFQEEVNIIFDCGEAYDSDNVTYAFYENDGTNVTKITEANTTVGANSDDGNFLDATLIITNGSSVDYAISYIGREMSAGNASSGATHTATSTAQGNADSADAPDSSRANQQALYETSVTIDDGSGNTIDSVDDNVRVTVNVTSTLAGTTLNGNESKAWFRWEVMHEQAWVDAVAANYIDHDAIKFELGNIRFTDNLCEAGAANFRLSVIHATNTNKFQIGENIGFVNDSSEADLSSGDPFLSTTVTAEEFRFPQVTDGATAGAVFNVVTAAFDNKHIYDGFGSNSGLGIPSPDKEGSGLLTSKYSNS